MSNGHNAYDDTPVAGMLANPRNYERYVQEWTVFVDWKLDQPDLSHERQAADDFPTFVEWLALGQKERELDVREKLNALLEEILLKE